MKTAEYGAFAAFFVTIVLLASYESSKDSEFEKWKEMFEVSFTTAAEEQYRRYIFEENLKTIHRHNSNTSNTYRMGINQFAIYSQEEFAHLFLSESPLKAANIEMKIGEIGADTVDWDAKGKVGPVKTQGMCATAVTYATLGSIQSFAAVVDGSLPGFSEQQLIDCVFGCGGYPGYSGFQYYSSQPTCTYQEYPLVGRKQNCHEKPCKFQIDGYQAISSCKDLLSAMKRQPVAVVIDATNWALYQSGIFANCGTSANHMVLATAITDDYWRLKNSWGLNWGEKGFIRLAKTNNICGICQQAYFPL